MAVPGRAATLSDVAAAAGVSTATASRVLHGTRTVGAELSARVAEAAARLQYAPNAQAQAMATGSTTVVGLLVHDIADPYFSSIAAGVSRAADESGFLVMLSTLNGRPEHELRYLRALRAQRVRAAILVGSRRSDEADLHLLRAEVRAFEEAGGRVVAISQASLPVDTLVIDNSGGAHSLATELSGLGYRRFGVLAGPQVLVTAQDRARGFQQGVLDAGHPAPVVVHGDFTRDGGYAAMTELLDGGHHVDCVFAVNDVMAVGALAACRDRGLTLPRDLALAGFDDIATLRDVTPSLTTVRLPLTEMGEEAMRLVAADPVARPRRRRVRGTVVVRSSTPPVRGAVRTGRRSGPSSR